MFMMTHCCTLFQYVFFCSVASNFNVIMTSHFFMCGKVGGEVKLNINNSNVLHSNGILQHLCVYERCLRILHTAISCDRTVPDGCSVLVRRSTRRMFRPCGHLSHEMAVSRSFFFFVCTTGRTLAVFFLYVQQAELSHV